MRIHRVLVSAAAFVLVVAALAAPPASFGQTATTTIHLFKIVPGAAWRGSDGNRYLTFGCAPLQRLRFGTEGSVVTFHLKFTTLPRIAGSVVDVWDSKTSLPAGRPCDLRKGIDTVTFQIPEGLHVQDPYIPVAKFDREGGRFNNSGTHGAPMYRLRDYSGPLRGTYTAPSPD